MTTVQRQNLRVSLLAQGFRRIKYTTDRKKNGSYAELWALGENKVVISWGPKVKKDVPKF